MAKEATKPAVVEQKKVHPAPTYDAKEFIANAEPLFGYSADIVTAALATAHRDRCTLGEAKELIKKFAERKVV